jgi:uncharacterized membrane protein YuzA (DUF378 family)
MNKKIDMAADILVLVGALNWGLDALEYNLVEMIIPEDFRMYIYLTIGAAALWMGYKKFM